MHVPSACTDEDRDANNGVGKGEVSTTVLIVTMQNLFGYKSGAFLEELQRVVGGEVAQRGWGKKVAYRVLLEEDANGQYSKVANMLRQQNLSEYISFRSHLIGNLNLFGTALSTSSTLTTLCSPHIMLALTECIHLTDKHLAGGGKLTLGQLRDAIVTSDPLKTREEASYRT